MSAAAFVDRYPWPWLIVPEPSAGILQRIRRPETVIASAQTQAIEFVDQAHLRGASLDALCLEARPLRGDERIVVGRSAESDVVLLHESVSRQHAVIVHERRWTLKDQGAKNGTRVGARTLEPHETCSVEDGDALLLGAVPCRFYTSEGFLAWLEAGAPRSGAAPGAWPE